MTKTLAELLKLAPPGRGAFVRVAKSGPAGLVMPGPADKPTVDTRRMAVTSVIATGRRDRDGDIVVPSGAILDDHRINPVVMYYHGKNGNLPIGKAEDPAGNYTVRLAGDRLVADTYFAQKNQFACDVFELIADDVLRGTSVGFDPVVCKAIGPQPDEDTRPPMQYDSWRMFEYSHAPIGVNREALTVAVHKALDGSRRMHPLLVKGLERFAAPRKTQVVVPGVTKAMPMDDLDDDDATNGTGDTALVPDDAAGDTPPTAAAFYDYAQAISDATAAFEAATAKSEHVPSHKEIDRVLAEAEKFQAKLTAHADKVQASLGGGDDEGSETAEDVDFDDEPDDDELVPVQKARDGTLIVKSYTPRRWGPRDLARAERAAASAPQPDPEKLKALALRIAANEKRIRAERDAADKESRIADRNARRARGDDY